MAMSISNYQMLTRLAANPLSATESTGYASKIFGAGVNALYGTKVNNLAKGELSNYLKSFASSASAVSASASKLNSANKENAFNERSAGISNKSVASASASAGAELKTYNIKVDTVAKAQVNRSASVDAAAVNTVGEGKKTFTIEAGGKKTDVSIDIKANYTNRDVMRLATEAINKGNTGIRSRVVEEGNGKISMELSGNLTGKENTFRITDKEGDVVSSTKSDTISSAASDSSYSIDGKNYTSDKNEVQLDNKRVQVTLRGTGDTTVEVAVDKSKVTKAAEDLAASYNSTMNFLRENNLSSNTARLSQELGNAVKFKRSSLEGIGMSVDRDGQLSVDTKKFEAAMKQNPDRVERVLSGVNGLGSRLESISNQATKKPIVNFSDLINTDSSGGIKLKAMDQLSIDRYAQQGLLFNTTT